MRAALAGRADPIWIVGGTVRDALLERPIVDVDMAIDGDAHGAAEAIRRHTGGPIFRLSDEFGSWRALAPDRSWHADLTPLQGDTIEADLAQRDFTVNAVAVPLAGGEPDRPPGRPPGPREAAACT